MNIGIRPSVKSIKLKRDAKQTRLKNNSDASEARLGILPKTYTSSKKRQGYVLLSRGGMGTPAASTRDLNSAELETMRTSRGPTTVMTANVEVQTREEATVCVTQLNLFVKVMLLEETPAVLSLEKLCEDQWYTYHWTSIKNHISSEMARELIALYPTMYHLWFLVSQRVLPQLHLHLHRIPYLMSTDTPKIQYQKEVEVRVKSFGETRCMNTQKPKTKFKMVNQKKYKEIFRMSCLIRYRNSVRIWFDESTSTETWENPEHGSQDTSKSSHELPMEPRAKVEPGSGKHSVYTHFPKDRNCEICQRTNITRAPCRRRIGEAVPRADNFGDLIKADHKVLSEGCESRNNHRYAVVVQDSATQCGIRAKHKLLRKHKGACKSSWSRIGRLKSFTLTIPWNLAKLVKIFPGIIVRLHHTDRKQMGLLKEQCAE